MACSGSLRKQVVGGDSNPGLPDFKAPFHHARPESPLWTVPRTLPKYHRQGQVHSGDFMGEYGSCNQQGSTVPGVSRLVLYLPYHGHSATTH